MQRTRFGNGQKRGRKNGSFRALGDKAPPIPASHHDREMVVQVARIVESQAQPGPVH